MSRDRRSSESQIHIQDGRPAVEGWVHARAPLRESTVYRSIDGFTAKERWNFRALLSLYRYRSDAVE
jgi:hypothetical protein